MRTKGLILGMILLPFIGICQEVTDAMVKQAKEELMTINGALKADTCDGGNYTLTETSHEIIQGVRKLILDSLDLTGMEDMRGSCAVRIFISCNGNISYHFSVTRDDLQSESMEMIRRFADASSKVKSINMTLIEPGDKPYNLMSQGVIRLNYDKKVKFHLNG